MTHPLKCLIPTIGSPATLNQKEGRYELANFYGALLDFKVVNEGWLLIADGLPPDGAKFFLALDGDGWEDARPPRWPDPEFPLQMHLDILVPDLSAAAALVTGMGASLLKQYSDFEVFTDPVGPLCLYHEPAVTKPVVGRVMFDCFSHALWQASTKAFSELAGVSKMPRNGSSSTSATRNCRTWGSNTQSSPPRAGPTLTIQRRYTSTTDGTTGTRRRPPWKGRKRSVRLPQHADTEIYGDPASHPFCIQNEIPS